MILPPLAAAHWLHQLVLGAPLQDARGRVRHLVIDYDGPRRLCDPETRHEALREIRAAGVPVWFATRPSCNREQSMHVYVLLDRPMPADEAAEHVRRLLRAKPGAPPGQWCEILVGACRLPAGLDAARLDPVTGAELKESPAEQLRSILQLRGTCDRLRVRRCPIRVPRMAQDTRGSFAAGPGAETCLNRAPSPLEAIAAAAEARAERYGSSRRPRAVSGRASDPSGRWLGIDRARSHSCCAPDRYNRVAGTHWRGLWVITHTLRASTSTKFSRPSTRSRSRAPRGPSCAAGEPTARDRHSRARAAA